MGDPRDFFGNNYRDGYVAMPYVYKPEWEKDVERSPDKLPSHSKIVFLDRGSDGICLLEIKSMNGEMLGVLMFSGDVTGKTGLAAFTKDELQHA